jgi:hypothetical protein
MKINTKEIFYSLSLSTVAVGLFLQNGIVPQPNPVKPNEYIIPRNSLTIDDWKSVFRRHDVIFLGFSYAFATSGATLTLPTDFSTTNNIIYCIGAGGAGSTAQAGDGGTAPCPCSGCPGTLPSAGEGGAGGGGGACAEKNNYNLHAAGQSVSILVGSGNTWFHSATTVLARPGSAAIVFGSPGAGGSNSTCIGDVKITGGAGANGSLPFVCGVGGTGGTGGNAAGPFTLGGHALAGAGGTGGAGSIGPSTPGATGGVGNQYGGGGAGGGGGGAYTFGDPGQRAGAGGAGYQGIIGIQYLSTKLTQYYFFPSAF